MQERNLGGGKRAYPGKRGHIVILCDELSLPRTYLHYLTTQIVIRRSTKVLIYQAVEEMSVHPQYSYCFCQYYSMWNWKI